MRGWGGDGADWKAGPQYCVLAEISMQECGLTIAGSSVCFSREARHSAFTCFFLIFKCWQLIYNRKDVFVG